MLPPDTATAAAWPDILIPVLSTALAPAWPCALAFMLVPPAVRLALALAMLSAAPVIGICVLSAPAAVATSSADASSAWTIPAAGLNASVIPAQELDVLVVPPVAAAGSYAPLSQSNDATNEPMPEVVPSPSALTIDVIPLGTVNALPVEPCAPAPRASIFAPLVTGVIDGQSGLDAFTPVAVTAETSIGVVASTPRQTRTIASPP